jgi:ABC-type antimicrobial peptide transport system permease subunit
MIKFPIGSYYAIIGFVVGSIVCIFFNYFTNNSTITPEAVEAGNGYIYPSLLNEPWRIVLGIFALAFGIALSFILGLMSEKKNKNSNDKADNEAKNENIDLDKKVSNE